MSFDAQRILCLQSLPRSNLPSRENVLNTQYYRIEGGSAPPPLVIFERQILPQQTIYRWKGNLMLRSRLRIEVRPTENDLTQLYKNGDILVVITCS